MFKILILKEIHEAVLNFRFWLISVLCLILIPLGLYVASMDYQLRVEESLHDQKNYLENIKGNTGDDVKAEGFFLPTPLSILSSGFRDYLPYQAITSNDGYVKMQKKQQNSNLQNVLFGKIDFVFIVTNFLSLLSLIFTFGSISAEKEMGTLKLVLSNPIPRWKVILAKICGNYVVFLAPFIIAVIIGLFMVQFVTGVNLLSVQYLSALAIVLVFTLIFLFIFFNLGIWASVVSKGTITSIVILLFIWVFFSLGIPRISPMLAQIIHPVKTEDVFRKEYDMLQKQIQNDQHNESKDLLEKLVIDKSIEINIRQIPDLDDIVKNKTNYSQLITPINIKYKQRLSTELGNLEKEFQETRELQMVIASNLSRISPVSSYIFLTTELCSTGLLELKNCQETAQLFQTQVTLDVYSKYTREWLGFKQFSTEGGRLKEGFIQGNIHIPEMTQYKPVSLNAIFQKTWPDYVLLIWYSVFFFTGAFVSFLKYDVR